MTDSTHPLEVIRSEERLHVGLERVATRVARLERFVVTERRTIEVDVRREAVRLVYDEVPAGTSTAAALASRVLPEVVLSEERVEIRTVTVPVERVRLVLDAVTEHLDVSADVRKEQVEVDRATPAGLPR